MGLRLRRWSAYESEGEIRMISVNEFKELLEKNSSVSAYEIKDRVNESFQLFYVMRNLETNRSVNVEELIAEIYVDFDEFRGSSSVTVTSADDLETVAKKIDEAIEKAKKAKNPYYPLVSKTENLTKISENKQNLALNAKIAADAIFAGEGQENSQLNATEVFADHDRIHFLNSNGVEHVYDEYAMFYETIPSYNGEKEDVELYFNQYNGAPDQEKYSSDIRTALANVKYRYNAVKPADVSIPENTLIAVQKDMLNDVLTNFASELNYNRQYYKMSHFSIGDRISEVPFDMVLKGEEEGVSNSSPVDGNGIILRETKVIDQGVAAAYWGNQRFGYYLKEKEITGNYPVAVISNYPVISEEDSKRPQLIIMNFSSPQLDTASGYFGGEVRLGLLKIGDEATPLTGFSISGNIYEAINTVRFSKETDVVCPKNSMSVKGPKFLYFDQVKLH